MATTTTQYATGTPTQVAGTWTNPTNATGAPNATGTTAPTNCATWVNAARSTTATLELAGYNFSSEVASSATVTAVTATIPHAETSTTNISALTAQLYSGATAIGTAVAVTRVTSLTTHTVSFPTMPTVAQLADLRVRITSTRANNTTSSTQYIDAVGLQVTYTPPAKISTLADDFTTADSTKWAFGAAATVTGGQLVLTPNASYTGYALSNISYDLTGSSFYVQLAQRANIGNGTTQSYIEIGTSTDSVLFTLVGTTLIPERKVSSVTTDFPAVTYDPVAHQWLRIRESGGTIFWDTSPDGSTWTDVTSWLSTIPMTAMFVTLGSGFFGTEPSPGTVIWDNVNVTPSASTPATAAGTVTLAGSATGAASPDAAGAVTLTGSGTPGARGTGTGTVTLGGSGASSATVAAAGALTLAGSGTARASTTAAGTVTLSGTGSATATATAAGSITLAATGTAAAAAAASGAVTLGGTATGQARPTATGSITLGGSATGTVPGVNTATGTITLSGSAAATATATATGGLTLSGAATASAPATSLGAIILTGTATAASGAVPASAAGTITIGGVATALVPATAQGLIFLSGLANVGAAIVAGPLETLVVPAENRTYRVAAETRLLEVPGENRRFPVSPDDRTDTVPADTHTLAATGS